MTAQLYDRQIVRAMGLMIISMAWFSLMNIFIRHAADELHTSQIVFLRNIFSVLMLLPWVLRAGISSLKTTRVSGHFWRGTVGMVGMQLWFYCVATLPLNEATALSFTAPIFTSIIAIMFLGERAGWRRWSAIMIGFIGAMIIIHPDPDHIDWNMLIVPCATTLWAVAGVLVKSLTQTEPANRIVFYMALVMSVWSLPFAIPHWQNPSLIVWVMVLGVAVCSTGAHLFMVRAYAKADVVVLMPFDFFRLIFTAIFAYVAFDEVASLSTWVGGAVIVGSAAYISYREALHRSKNPAKPVVE